MRWVWKKRRVKEGWGWGEGKKKWKKKKEISRRIWCGEREEEGIGCFVKKSYCSYILLD